MAVYRTSPDPPEDDDRQLPIPADQVQDPQSGDPAWKPPGGLKMPSMDTVKGFFSGGINNLMDDIVVALGSENIYVASREHPEPAAFASYIAVSRANGQVIALGEKARAMMGREPQNIEVIPLLHHGVPESPDLFASFIQRVIKKHFSRMVRPRILCSGNFNSPLLKQVCSEGLSQVRCRDILFCEPEIAAAVGLGLDILEPSLKSVLVFEKDWMGFMVISLTGSLTKVRLNIGFDHMLEDIQIYFEESNDFSPREEDLVQQFRSSGFTGNQNLIGWEAWVDQVERGKPVTLQADSMEYQKAVTPTLLRVKHAVNKSLQALTREQRYTVQTTPTYLAGEFAELPGFKELLERVFGREFRIGQNPRQTMAAGLVALIPNIDVLRAINGGEAQEVDF
ncbi:MAG: rod shape-determining protein [Verrucomicrobiota bacterium]